MLLTGSLLAAACGSTDDGGASGETSGAPPTDFSEAAGLVESVDTAIARFDDNFTGTTTAQVRAAWPRSFGDDAGELLDVGDWTPMESLPCTEDAAVRPLLAGTDHPQEGTFMGGATDEFVYGQVDDGLDPRYVIAACDAGSASNWTTVPENQ